MPEPLGQVGDDFGRYYDIHRINFTPIDAPFFPNEGPELAVQLKNNFSKSPIPGFDFALAAPPGPQPAPYKVKMDATSFQFWLVLADQGQASFIFKFVRGVPGMALTGATRVVNADGSVSLVALPAGDPDFAPYLVSRGGEPGDALGPALLVSGSESVPASLRFTPDTDSTEGVVALGLEPRAMRGR